MPNSKLRFHVQDLTHEGAVRFFKHIVPTNVLTDAISIVLQVLYTRGLPQPPVRSITLILRPFDGVAFTKGTELDNEHKEIHLSLDYLAGIDIEGNQRRDEMIGVIVHEMVHVLQWNGQGTCPGGLIEGIADYVRLRAGLGAAHWKREKSEQWDAGYQQTGYFLDWLENQHGPGTVIKMNAWLKNHRYDEEGFWHSIVGNSVHKLWEQYQEHFDEKKA